MSDIQRDDKMRRDDKLLCDFLRREIFLLRRNNFFLRLYIFLTRLYFFVSVSTRRQLLSLSNKLNIN